MTRTRWALAAVVAVVLLGGGVALGAAVFGGPDREPSGPAPSKVDIGFAQDMIVHHQQAVDMAAIAGPRLRGQTAALADQIRVAQQREIGQLQGWLTAWDAPQLADQPMTWMPHEDSGAADSEGSSHDGHGGADHEGSDHGGAGEQPPMPGMASMPELQRLGELQGAELQRSFCQLMLRHHHGGVAMAQAAAARAAEPYVRAAAAVMAAEQQKEMATMSALLRDLGGKPLPQR